MIASRFIVLIYTACCRHYRSNAWKLIGVSQSRFYHGLVKTSHFHIWDYPIHCRLFSSKCSLFTRCEFLAFLAHQVQLWSREVISISLEWTLFYFASGINWITYYSLIKWRAKYFLMHSFLVWHSHNGRCVGTWQSL